MLAATFSEIGGDIDVAIADALASLPGFFDPLWLVLAWTPVAWSVVLIVVSLLRGRRALARDLVAGVAASLLVAVFLAALLGDGAWDSLTRFADLDGPPAFPPGALTISAAVIATASPHLSRPFRHFGRWIVGGQFLATMVLGAALPSGSVVAVTVGLIAAAIVHLIVGSPGGRPTTSRIELALRGLGVDVVELTPTVMHAHGVVSFTGSRRRGTDRRQGLRPRRVGRPAADHGVAIRLVPGHPAHGPAEPARARRARRVHDPARRPRRRACAEPRDGGKRRTWRRPRRRPPRRRAGVGVRR